MLLRNFSHIYVEDQARDYADTALVLNRFPDAKIVSIRSYKEIFNRPRQDWAAQKESRSLILAVRKDNFLYPGTSVAPHFGFKHFYYNSPILNCIYDCDYCYLQGMYPSANIVIFVNTEDYFTHTDEALKTKTPLYLCISYDTDLLAFSGIIPLAERWIRYASERKDLLIELRTKSAAYNTIKHLTPSENVVLAWTLSPSSVCSSNENRAPTLDSRIDAILRAAEDGWRIRLCFDPLLLVPGWEDIYRDFFSYTFGRIPAEKIREVSIGSFRINADYLRAIQKHRTDSKILFYPFEVHDDIAQYPVTEDVKLKTRILEEVVRYIPREKISIVTV